MDPASSPPVTGKADDKSGSLDAFKAALDDYFRHSDFDAIALTEYFKEEYGNQYGDLALDKLPGPVQDAFDHIKATGASAEAFKGTFQFSTVFVVSSVEIGLDSTAARCGPTGRWDTKGIYGFDANAGVLLSGTFGECVDWGGTLATSQQTGVEWDSPPHAP
jgi:hypothetical protein